MKRNGLKIRIWLTMAFAAAASLVVASSAGARLYTGDVGDGGAISQTPVVANPGGFAWADAAIGAAVALAVALIALGLAYVARNRSHLETSH